MATPAGRMSCPNNSRRFHIRASFNGNTSPRVRVETVGKIPFRIDWIVVKTKPRTRTNDRRPSAGQTHVDARSAGLASDRKIHEFFLGSATLRSITWEKPYDSWQLLETQKLYNLRNSWIISSDILPENTPRSLISEPECLAIYISFLHLRFAK